MIITGCLTWYAETPATLERCARSLGGFCDYLLAVGGRWDGFPPIDDDDPAEQVRALERGCQEADVFFDVLIADGVFESQVEKRDLLMRTAPSCGDPDWLFVIDADEFIVEADTDAVAETLAETTADAAHITGVKVPLTMTSPTRPWRRMYRASTGVTVETAHNGYRTADGRWLYGNPGHVELAPSVDLTKHVLLAHDAAARPPERREARRAYLLHRRDQQTEAWPEPVTA